MAAQRGGLSWNHRIIEWPGLKRTTVIIQFQAPCYVQGCQPPDQAAQSHIQPGLECLQGSIHNLLGQPVPMRHHPLREKLPPNISPKPPLSQFKTIPPCPITIHPRKQPFPILFICFLQVWEGRNEVSLEPSLFQTKQAQFPLPFLIGEVLQPSDHLSGPPLDPVQELHILPVLGPQAWMPYSRWGLIRAK